MAIAETARLLASLELQDKLTPGVNKALAGVGKLESGVGGLQTKLGGLAKNISGGVSGALSTFGGRIRQLGVGLAAGLGIGGLLSFGGAIKEALGEAQTFGAEVIRLSALTGLTTESTSALAAAFHHFGIDADTAARLAGLAEKNLGNLTATQKKATAFQKLYGLSLIDNKGHVKDFNTLILDSADFFNNKSIPAQTKAAALAKLFGRSWQDLIPILKAGRKGIADAEQEAKDLGLTLTNENIVALKKARDASRDWGTALGGLKLQIGLNILPVLTDLAKSATKFVSEHRLDIVSFFKNTIEFGRHAASVIGDFAGKVAGAWNSIPPAMRDFLVKGFIADRTLKFLFGISPIKLAVDFAANTLGGIGKSVGSAVGGSLLAAFVKPIPVFVTNPGFGGGGVPGAVPTGGGGISTLGKFFLVGEAIGLVAAVIAVGQKVSDSALQQSQDIQGALTAGLAGPQTVAQLQQKLAGIDQGISELKADPIAAALITGPTIAALEKMRADIVAALDVKNLNKLGSPDDRDTQHKEAMAVAKALDAKTARLNTRIEDVGAKVKTGASDTKAKLTAAKTAIDTARIAIDDRVQATRSAVQTGSQNIVGALQNLSLGTTIPFVVNIDGVKVSSGTVDTTLHTSGGGGGKKRIG